MNNKGINGINELKIKKEVLEQQINGLLVQFMDEANVDIFSVDVELRHPATMNLPEDGHIIPSVEIKLDI